MKEWICQEEPLIRADGASVGVGFRQMVELIRCKDCKHYEYGYGCKLWHTIYNQNDDFFCADGERRTGDG